MIHWGRAPSLGQASSVSRRADASGAASLGNHAAIAPDIGITSGLGYRGAQRSTDRGESTNATARSEDQ